MVPLFCMRTGEARQGIAKSGIGELTMLHKHYVIIIRLMHFCYTVIFYKNKALYCKILQSIITGREIRDTAGH